MGKIYFILSGVPTEERSFVKIGWAKDLKTRIATLQTASPLQFVLLGVEEGDRKDEGEWHKRMARFRFRGEWFEAEPVMEMLEEHWGTWLPRTRIGLQYPGALDECPRCFGSDSGASRPFYPAKIVSKTPIQEKWWDSLGRHEIKFSYQCSSCGVRWISWQVESFAAGDWILEV